jgi:hypothetical protein
MMSKPEIEEAFDFLMQDEFRAGRVDGIESAARLLERLAVDRLYNVHDRELLANVGTLLREMAAENK